MDVEINGKYTEKNANCILNDDAYPAAGAVVQGNFLCSVDLSPSEYTNTNFTTAYNCALCMYVHISVYNIR